MINNKKIIVVIPAYNASKTIEDTVLNIPLEFVDEIILVDDNSSDNTVEISKKLGIKTIAHDKNSGYGANQKTCYKEALKNNADIIIMLHGDGQYDPKLIPTLAANLAYNNYDCAIASRMLLTSAKKNMPKYKYFANKFLTSFQNLLLNKNLSEYHSGYRAFNSYVISKIPIDKLSNGFIFDNEMLALIYYNNFTIGEISCPCKYFKNASSISLLPSVKYGLRVLLVSIQYFISKVLKIKTGVFK